MLKKLLKYDLKREFKGIVPMYVIALLMPIIIRIMDLITKKAPFFSVISNIVFVIYVILLVGIFFLTFFNSIKNFLNNVLKDEGYLTHTLPIKRSHIIISKEITSMITIIATLIVVAISATLAFYDGASITTILDTIIDFGKQFAMIYGMGANEFLIFLIVSIVLGYLGNIILFQLSLILGHTRNENRIIFSIVFGIIIYVVLQILSLIGIGIDILLRPELLNEMNTTIMDPIEIASVIRLIMYTQLILSTITTIVTHILSCVILNKKLNLE